MPDEIQRFLEDTTAQVRPLEKALNLTDWDVAVAGTPEALEKNQQAQAAYLRFWADPDRFEAARRYDQEGSSDPITARQVRLIYLSTARNQQDEATIERLTALESEVRGKYTNFRAQLDGREMNDNEIDDVLRNSADAHEVRAIWEASKQIGAEVAPQVRELARLRNATARRQGFRDHFHRSLTLDEIDEEQLLSLFGKLEAESERAFDRLKQSIDDARSRHFGVSPAALRPWHYGDRFFQEVPATEELDMNQLFADKDPVALTTATYDGIGMDIRDVVKRSDLLPRPGKNQHAFCTHIDRDGDIRTLNNLQPNHRWNETLLHEMGHAVYEVYLDPGLPWLLRTPAHILSTEAIAIMMQKVTYDEAWLTSILGLERGRASSIANAARRQRQAADLIFTRWCLVMTNFERRMYADPEADLDTIWWDLVERYQKLRRPEGRQAPDWAAKIHVALAPVYYQNYELGHLISAQLLHHLDRIADGLVGKSQAGTWLKERFFAPGARQDWSTHVASATGEALDPRYFVEGLNGG